MADHQGSGAVLLDGKRLTKWGLDPQAFKNAIRRVETFFKHALKDPNDSYTLSPLEAESVFYSAIERYRRLVREKSAFMGLFMA